MDDGRYCLNDLHRASGGARRHTPGRFTITKQFKDLVAELSRNRDNAAPVTSSAGVCTYVAKRTGEVSKFGEFVELAEHYRLNFEPTSFQVAGPRGGVRSEPMYRMTAKGLPELAMSFTGNEARLIPTIGAYLAAYRLVRTGRFLARHVSVTAVSMETCLETRLETGGGSVESVKRLSIKIWAEPRPETCHSPWFWQTTGLRRSVQPLQRPGARGWYPLGIPGECAGAGCIDLALLHVPTSARHEYIPPFCLE